MKFINTVYELNGGVAHYNATFYNRVAQECWKGLHKVRHITKIYAMVWFPGFSATVELEVGLPTNSAATPKRSRASQRPKLPVFGKDLFVLQLRVWVF